jgi:hypothetical protein
MGRDAFSHTLYFLTHALFVASGSNSKSRAWGAHGLNASLFESFIAPLLNSVPFLIKQLDVELLGEVLHVRLIY